jgi:hypothetical protein
MFERWYQACPCREGKRGKGGAYSGVKVFVAPRVLAKRVASVGYILRKILMVVAFFHIKQTL